MNDMKSVYNDTFWYSMEKLISDSEIVIDRPKGSPHPRIHEIVYPFDYGYLKNTSSMDGDGIDLWVGSEEEKQLKGIIVTVDLWKRDSEIKLLLGTTDDEIEIIHAFLNKREIMSGLLILRENVR